jgi:hypothetical protein
MRPGLEERDRALFAVGVLKPWSKLVVGGGEARARILTYVSIAVQQNHLQPSLLKQTT